VTTEEEVLGRVVGLLETLVIPYMVGSIAASYHGRPRATHDADVVIDPTATQLDALLEGLAAGGFYVDVDRAREALHLRRQFNAIERARATKVDLIVRKARPFSIEEFGRRQRVDLSFARGVATVTAEDSVLSKLEWARQSGDSARQLRDAAGVVELNPALDRMYVRKWAEELGVADLWEQIVAGG
jgi:hypothetical protein